MTGGLSFTICDREIASIPVGRLIEIRGTATLPDNDWLSLAKMPLGLFYINRSGNPVPIDSSDAVRMKYSDGAWPDPIFASDARLAELKASFPKETAHLPLGRVFIDSRPIGFVPHNGITLYPFQRDAVQRFLAEKRMLLLLRVGSGKTLPAVVAAEELRNRGVIDKVVVVASSTLLTDMWTPTVRTVTGTVPSLVNGPVAKRVAQWTADVPWVLSKYDTWRTDGKTLRAVLNPRTMVIIDEVHHLKSPDTKRWKATKELLDGCGVDYRLFLTGTLLWDRPMDAYGPISLLGLRVWNRREEFQNRYFTFKQIFTGRVRSDGGPVTVWVPDELNSPEDAALLRDAIDRVSFHPVVDWSLPSLTESTRIITATPEEEALYSAVVTNPLGKAINKGEGEKSVLSILTMERLLSSDPWVLYCSESETAKEIVARVGASKLLALSPGSKAKALVAYLSEFLEEDADTKVVVFSAFTGLPRLILDPSIPTDAEFSDSVSDVRAASVFLHGELKTEERESVLSRFKQNPSTRILFSTDIGGEGIDGLQGVANQVIHYDDPLSLGKLEQRVGRVWRRGQTKPVLSLRFEMSLEATLTQMLMGLNPSAYIDSRIRDLLKWKSGQRNMVWSVMGSTKTNDGATTDSAVG